MSRQTSGREPSTSVKPYSTASWPELTDCWSHRVDAPSIHAARGNAVEAGVADRVRFRLAPSTSLEGNGSYDAVFAFECLHDLSDPVAVLASMGRLAGDDGVVVVVVMDESGSPTPSPGPSDSVASAEPAVVLTGAVDLCLEALRKRCHDVLLGRSPADLAGGVEKDNSMGRGAVDRRSTVAPGCIAPVYREVYRARDTRQALPRYTSTTPAKHESPNYRRRRRRRRPTRKAAGANP